MDLYEWRPRAGMEAYQGDLLIQELDGKLLEPEILRERVMGDVVGCEGRIDPLEERVREDAYH